MNKIIKTRYGEAKVVKSKDIEEFEMINTMTFSAYEVYEIGYSENGLVAIEI